MRAINSQRAPAILFPPDPKAHLADSTSTWAAVIRLPQLSMNALGKSDRYSKLSYEDEEFPTLVDVRGEEMFDKELDKEPDAEVDEVDSFPCNRWLRGGSKPLLSVFALGRMRTAGDETGERGGEAPLRGVLELERGDCGVELKLKEAEGD